MKLILDQIGGLYGNDIHMPGHSETSIREEVEGGWLILYSCMDWPQRNLLLATKQWKKLYFTLWIDNGTYHFQIKSKFDWIKSDLIAISDRKMRHRSESIGIEYKMIIKLFWKKNTHIRSLVHFSIWAMNSPRTIQDNMLKFKHIIY